MLGKKNEMLLSAPLWQAKLASENLQRQDFTWRTGEGWCLAAGRQSDNAFLAGSELCACRPEIDSFSAISLK